MPASLTETLPDGRTLEVAVDLSFKAAETRGPIPPDPKTWSWENLHPTTCGRMTAPRAFAEKAMAIAEVCRAANIRHYEKSQRGDGRITVIFWNEPVMRTQPAAFDPFCVVNITEMDTVIDASDSPNGKELHLLRKVRVTKSDLRLNMEPKEIDLQHRDLQPGEAFLLRGPTDFIKPRLNVAGTYIKRDASARNYYKRLAEHDDGSVSYIIWCDALA